MKKIIKYIVNITIFITLWCVPTFLVAGYSIAENGQKPSGIVAFVGVLAIIISYRLVKRMNKSKLWSLLFVDPAVNELVEENIDVKVIISRRRHFFKAITWNLLAMTTTFYILSYLPPYFGFEAIDKSSVGWLVILDRVVKLIFYYFHERTWFASNWGIIKPKI